MAADTYSAILGVLLMGTGNDANSWGDNCNTSIFTVLESAIAKKATHAVTGGTLDQSGSPPPAGPTAVIEMIHVFTGTLASTQIWIVPNLSKVFIVDNQCAGAFGLQIKTTSGTAINLPAGTTTVVFCDGANVIKRLDAQQVGNIISHAGTTLPGGTFECDGSSKLIADYPDLYAKISTTYGGNGITTFLLPDYKTAGRFLRSRTGSVTVGTNQAADIAAHNHTATGSTSASGTALSDGAHTHNVSITDSGHFHPANSGASFYTNAAVGAGPFGAGVIGPFQDGFTGGAVTGVLVSVLSGGTHTHTLSISASTSVTVNNSTGTETRPINASVMMAIKF